MSRKPKLGRWIRDPETQRLQRMTKGLEEMVRGERSRALRFWIDRWWPDVEAFVCARIEEEAKKA